MEKNLYTFYMYLLSVNCLMSSSSSFELNGLISIKTIIALGLTTVMTMWDTT